MTRAQQIRFAVIQCRAMAVKEFGPMILDGLNARAAYQDRAWLIATVRRLLAENERLRQKEPAS